ncbi:hypothetical protein Cylst_2726 [Cylindrospermum stagnale PCC 7417]|uniref:Uncharacterized protein n=1 Tax=Cylindrospermum stagnale PCC 7417 TaxID=56107 RepID=K9WXH8_9NOST|nr:hypothetical protein [Cylindrospermum stagnale]AFZ24923.1 hypothetical protein Cylst_2726 [Cylindrospermum stagnale PCC 7417]
MKYLKFPALSAILGVNLAIAALAPQALAVDKFISVGTSVTFTCNDSEAKIKAKNGPKVTVGTTNIYVGYQQVSSINQDPRIIRFDNGVKKWCRSDYETTLDDGRGYGLLWDGKGVLYGVFSSTGNQTGNDFRRFSTGRWLPTYGNGGGPKVAVIARIDPTNGNVNYSTYLTAKKYSDGKTNSLVVKALSWNGTSLTVEADSWWSPRRANTSSMLCSGISPFKYTTVFSGDLKTVSWAAASGCN